MIWWGVLASVKSCCQTEMQKEPGLRNFDITVSFQHLSYITKMLELDMFKKFGDTSFVPGFFICRKWNVRKRLVEEILRVVRRK